MRFVKRPVNSPGHLNLAPSGLAAVLLGNAAVWAEKPFQLFRSLLLKRPLNSHVPQVISPPL
jgi:hypothetical protein